MSSVDTFCENALGFCEKHRDLDTQQQTFGGLVWGLLRTLAECPNCPKTYRIPLDPDWNVMVCPECGMLFQHKDCSPVEFELIVAQAKARMAEGKPPWPTSEVAR